MTALTHTTGVNSVLPAFRCACATAAEGRMARAHRITCQLGLVVGLAMFAAGFVPGLVHPAVMLAGFALCFISAAVLRGGLGASDDAPLEPDEPFGGTNPATGLRMTRAGVDVGGNPLGVDNSRRD